MARTVVAIFAHNEEQRIARCIASLPTRSALFDFHLLVNGTTDRTVAVARALTANLPGFQVHDLVQGGKARTWNYFVETIFDHQTAAIFVDGDVEIRPGALEAMVTTLAENPTANGVNAIPVAGRRRADYRESILADHGVFGALYGLNGDFLGRLKASGIRLPHDLIGDDGLVAALAKTDLGTEADWRDDRIANCTAAAFASDTVEWRKPVSWALQFRRLVNYSVRRYQNIVISQVMRGPGPSALPPVLHLTYAEHWHLFAIRPRHAVFDWLAKRRMRRHLTQ